VVLTGHGTIDTAIEATRRGVYDYLQKPVEPQELKNILRKGLERSALRSEVKMLRREMARTGVMQGLVGNSPAMHELFGLIEQVAPTDAPVLITGESGTGKEIVARAIHRMSARVDKAMVAVNCAAIPENLLESEMFGHQKGAFTGAVSSREGCFELADHSTLLLDEIGEMPLALQTKILRVLESHRVQRVGSSRETEVDVRIIAATNFSLEELQNPENFRQDLYFRLNVFHIHLPPLRHRREDIPLLVERFARDISENEGRDPVVFSEDVLDVLCQHDWPGNAREVRNVVHRAVILCREGEVRPHHLPPTMRRRARPSRDAEGRLVVSLGTPISEVEKGLILQTLEANQGNKTRTASQLGISTKTLYTKLKRYEDGREAEARS
jgi:DNA-binding NtrC family response regulator